MFADTCPWRSILPCSKIAARFYCPSSDKSSRSVLVRTTTEMQRNILYQVFEDLYVACSRMYAQAHYGSFRRRIDSSTEQLSFHKEVSPSTGKHQSTQSILYVLIVDIPRY